MTDSTVIAVDVFARVVAHHLARTVIESANEPDAIERVEERMDDILQAMKDEMVRAFAAHRKARAVA